MCETIIRFNLKQKEIIIIMKYLTEMENWYNKQVFSVMFYFGIIQFLSSFSLTTLFEDFKSAEKRPIFLVFMNADDMQVEILVPPPPSRDQDTM